MADREAAGGFASEVGDLALEEDLAVPVELAASQGVEECFGGISLAAPPLDGAPDIEGHRQRAQHPTLLQLGARHRVTGQECTQTHLHDVGPRQVLGGLRIPGFDHHAVAVFVRHGDGRCRDAVDVESHHLEFWESAPHTVGIDQGETHAGCSHDRNHRVATADLDRGDEVCGLSTIGFESLDGESDVVAAGDLLDQHRRGADHRRGIDLGIVGHVFRRDDLRETEVADGLLGHEATEVGIAAAPGSEEGRASREVDEIFSREFQAWASPLVRRLASSPATFTRSRTAPPGM